MKDLNSAAQVSTFLNTGKILRAVLFLLTISSDKFDNSANFLSEKPIDLILLNSPKFFGRPLFLILFSLSTISLICSRNHGSIFDNLKNFFKLFFFLLLQQQVKVYLVYFL